MIDWLGQLYTADTFRYLSAALSVTALFLTSTAVVAYGKPVGREWRRLLWAFTAQQAVIAYVTVTRARVTPSTFPDQAPDASLVAILGSVMAIVVAGVGVFVAHRPRTVRDRG